MAGKFYNFTDLGEFITPNYYLSNISKLPNVDNADVKFVGGKPANKIVFQEYVYQTTDNSYMNFQVTNDVGDVEFNEMLEEKCSSLNISKNRMYLIKTLKGHIYEVGFTDFLKQQPCGSFSGVEFVSTHYKIKQNTNSILNSLQLTIKELKKHFNDLIGEKCNLYVYKKKNQYNKIGNLDNRMIYFKPNTNLVYLTSFDYKYTMNSQSFNSTQFVVQMTFGVKSWDCINVMCDMMSLKYENTKNKHQVNIINNCHTQMIKIKTLIEKLVENYNTNKKIKSIHKIDDSLDWRKILGALYCVLLRIDIYLNKFLTSDDKDENDENETSIKQYSDFQTRHSSNNLVKYMYNIYHKKYGNNIIDFLKVFLDPKILIKNKLFDKKRLDEPVGEDKLENFFNWYLDTFKYFNQPDKYDQDWFYNNKLDHLTENMPINDDVFLIENRQFNLMLILYLKNAMNMKVGREISLGNLYEFNDKLNTSSKTKRNKNKMNKTLKNNKSDDS